MLTKKIYCPICGAETQLFDVVDLNKSCGDITARSIGLSGIPIFYSRCNSCEFIFSPELYQWPKEKFSKLIYNDSYIRFDADYIETRPIGNARLIDDLFKNYRNQFKHLDYGGGNGRLAEELRKLGWDSTSFDPFFSGENNIPMEKFHLITAFEVFEHVSDLQNMMNFFKSRMLSKGVVLFSTLLSDGQINQEERLNWWYAAPRNGHISLFSKASLLILANKNGFNLESINSNLHLLRLNADSNS